MNATPAPEWRLIDHIRAVREAGYVVEVPTSHAQQLAEPGALDALHREVDSWPDDASLPWHPDGGKEGALLRLFRAVLGPDLKPTSNEPAPAVGSSPSRSNGLDDLPRMWWKPEDDEGPECLIVETVGGPKAYRREWHFGTPGWFTEWGWVLPDTAIPVALLAAQPTCVVCGGSGFAAPSVPCGDSWHDAEDAALAAEPAPVVTDEAVEAACERMHGPDVWQQMHASEQETKRAWMRFALEAAAPLLGPRPLLDREAVTEKLHAHDCRCDDPDHRVEYRAMAAFVMELARPMPTREQIDAFLQEWRVRPGGHRTQTEAVNYRRKMRNALLALLGGAES